MHSRQHDKKKHILKALLKNNQVKQIQKYANQKGKILSLLGPNKDNSSNQTETMTKTNYLILLLSLCRPNVLHEMKYILESPQTSY